MARTHTRFGGRTLARSQALQLLYQAELTGRDVDDVLDGDFAISDGPLDPYGERLARGVEATRHELDGLISGASSNWSISRMPAVDRNLLRIALFEMVHVDDVDAAIAIDEAVELAKAYGGDDSSKFINGVLGKVSRTLADGRAPDAGDQGAAAATDGAASDGPADAVDADAAAPAADADAAPAGSAEE